MVPKEGGKFSGESLYKNWDTQRMTSLISDEGNSLPCTDSYWDLSWTFQGELWVEWKEMDRYNNKRFRHD